MYELIGLSCTNKQATVGVVILTALILRARRVQLSRDCNDYKGTPADFLNIMNNSEFETFKVINICMPE